MVDLDFLDYLETQFLSPERRARFHEILKNRTRHFTVVVEDVFQLHNTSAVMRSCEVFGVQQLHVVEERYGKRIDKEIAMGAQKWVDVARHENIGDAIAAVKAQGYQIVATTPHADGCELADFDISPRSALFFGTERHGLSPEALEQADAFVKIPMVGFTESLNISVSAAIILQDVTSRLRKSNLDWRMSETAFLEKRLDWAKNSIKDIARIEARYYGK